MPSKAGNGTGLSWSGASAAAVPRPAVVGKPPGICGTKGGGDRSSNFHILIPTSVNLVPRVLYTPTLHHHTTTGSEPARTEDTYSVTATLADISKKEEIPCHLPNRATSK